MPTQPNLKDPQQLFDHVLTSLRKQGGPSWSNGVCLYRSPNGFKCAAGHCIPDDQYTPSLECGSVDTGFRKEFFTKLLGEENRRLLCDLQQVHDGCRGQWHMFEHDMRDLASRFNLVYTPCPPSQ